jgi:hypothetical protein
MKVRQGLSYSPRFLLEISPNMRSRHLDLSGPPAAAGFADQDIGIYGCACARSRGRRHTPLHSALAMPHGVRLHWPRPPPIMARIDPGIRLEGHWTMEQLEHALGRLGDLLTAADAEPHGLSPRPPTPGDDDALRSDLIDRAHLALSQGRSLLLGASARASDRPTIEFASVAELLASDIAFADLVARLEDGEGAAEFIEIRDAIHAVAMAAKHAAG